MKKITIPILLILLTIGTAYVVYKELKRGGEVVYINTPKLLAGYKGMKEARKKLEVKSQEWQANIDTLGKELEKAIQKFEKERATQSQKERQLSEQLLQNRQQSFMEYQQAIQKKAGAEEQKLQQEVLGCINDFIKEYGKKNHYRYIMGATQVGNIIYAEESADITDQVLKEINDKYNP